MKQEFTPPLFKAKRTDGNGWVEGSLITPSNDSYNCEIHNWAELHSGVFHRVIHPVFDTTLCMDSGLTAEWVADGIDPKIWSGDLFEAETISGNYKKWKVIYKNAAFYIQRTDDEEIEVLLYKFLENNVYTKIGSIHDKK